MPELHDLTALELGAAIAHRDVSIGEVTQHFLDRAERLDEVGAFTTVAADHAHSLAASLETRISDGSPRSPLFGVPVSIKDLEATRGIRTTLGSAVYRDWVPTHDDEIVTILRDAGLVDLGKTTVPELGAACYTEPEVAPPSRSPFDLMRSAAGSSGGAAAAVGAGLVPLSQGSDTAGSLRSPAAACGVVGLKPSRGLITAGPNAGDGIGLSSKGPIARTVADTAALLDVMASRPGSGTVHPPRSGSFLAALRPPAPLRVAIITESISGAPVDPLVADAVSDTGRMLQQFGHHVDEHMQPVDEEFTEAFTVTFSALAGAKPVPDGAEERLRPIVQHLRRRAAAATAGELAASIAVMQSRARAWTLALDAVDIVVTPTVTQLPMPVGGLRNDADPAAELRAMTAFTGNTIIANATGHPSISLPLGWTDDGVPIGVMLSANWGADALLLAIAAHLELAMPWAWRYSKTRTHA